MRSVLIYSAAFLNIKEGVMEVFSALTLAQSTKILVSTIPVGFCAGCIPFLVGLGVYAIVKIFKRV